MCRKLFSGVHIDGLENQGNISSFLSLGKPGKPGTPKIGKISSSTVDLTWVAPESDGGAPITNYFVEYKLESGRTWITSNTDTKVPELSYTVTGLKDTAIYEFRVTAENRAGKGPPSDSTKPTRVEEPLGKLGL